MAVPAAVAAPVAVPAVAPAWLLEDAAGVVVESVGC